MKTNNTARSITAAAIVGAAYAALTMLLAPISYGAIQVRVSEALCILPYFLPCTAWGLFAGCAIANVLTGNIFDIIFGSLATLAAVLTAARLGPGEAHPAQRVSGVQRKCRDKRGSHRRR